MKRALLLLLLVACGRSHFDPVADALPADASGCLVEDTSLAACWPFDGDGADLSMYGNDATATTVTYVAGAQGGAVRLATSSLITVPDGPAFDMARLTIMAWVRLDELPAAGRRALVFDNNEQWAFWVHPQGVGCTAGGISILPGTGLAVGRWYHVACVHRGTSLAAYVDGVKLEEQPCGALDTSGSGGARIGGNIPDAFNADPELLIGAIDDLQLYDMAFDDAAICAAVGAC